MNSSRSVAKSCSCLLVMTAVASGAAAADGGTARPKVETTLLSESFEESWPRAPWRVSHTTGTAEVDWGRTDHRASDGSHSIWCAASGPESPGTGNPAPADTATWAIAGPFDLAVTTSGRLTFDLWLETERYHDLFMWLVSTDGENFSGDAISTDTGGWKTMSADLTAWGEEGDVTGHPRVWIAFVYQSDHSGRYEGAYIDNVVLVADDGIRVAEGYTYTTDADFELGSSVGLEPGPDSLILASGWSALPFLWVPNSGTGSISKVDTESGEELARYRTGPDRDLDPSPVAIDLHGDCWVGNRGAGTVVKIGLAESGHCIDRDGNGAIETSRDADGDGNISAEEMFAWGADECVLYEISLVEGNEGSFVPGEVHEAYARNGLRAVAINARNEVWVGVHDSRIFYRIDGRTGEILETLPVATEEVHPFALVIDRNGLLWSAAWPDLTLLRIDPADGGFTSVDLSHDSRGLALDDQNHLFVTGFAAGAMSRVEVSRGEVEGTATAPWQANGVAATSDGDVWVAAPGSGSVSRFSSSGDLKATIPLANQPTGLAVDAKGGVWVMGVGTDVIIRLDPATNRDNLVTNLAGGGGHDAVGDMTGIVARSITTRFGTWTVIHDSAADMTPWGAVSWVGEEPEGTQIAARVRSSDDRTSWSDWVQTSNGDSLSGVPAGRYLQVDVSLQGGATDAAPVLEEVTVAPAVPPVVDFSWDPIEPAVGQVLRFADASSGGPTSWAWDFGDGGSSDVQNPEHTYETAGTYSVTLQVSNGFGSSTETSHVVVFQPGRHRSGLNRMVRP